VAILAGEAAFFLGRDELRLKPEEFEDVDIAALYAALLLEYNTAQSQIHASRREIGTAVRLPASLTKEQAMKFSQLALEAEREFEEGGVEEALSEVRASVSAIRLIRKSHERKRLEEEMREAELQGDSSRITDIAHRFNLIASPSQGGEGSYVQEV